MNLNTMFNIKKKKKTNTQKKKINKKTNKGRGITHRLQFIGANICVCDNVFACRRLLNTSLVLLQFFFSPLKYPLYFVLVAHLVCHCCFLFVRGPKFSVFLFFFPILFFPLFCLSSSFFPLSHNFCPSLFALIRLWTKNFRSKDHLLQLKHINILVSSPNGKHCTTPTRQNVIAIRAGSLVS